MQEIINAMLKVILDDGSQAKPIFNSVRRWNDMFVEFHSWYTFYFNEEYLEIVNAEKHIRERVRRAPDAKLSIGALRALKDWLNLDFNSWIAIEDETEEDSIAWESWLTDWDWWEDKSWEDSSVSEGTSKGDKEKETDWKKKMPSRAWVQVKKK